jgi:dimethylaniline monooxygenase (N-oxide forming)
MSKKSVVIVGAGPCGLVALKEMREAGHTAVALDKGPGIGGLFCPSHEAKGSYENLYLTISNMLMAFSDFPPEDLRIKYSSRDEYAAYLSAYADRFGLRPHVRLRTEVTRAVHEGGKWRITTRRVDLGEAEELEADALIVATGSNHVPRRMDTGAFAGEVLHSVDYQSPRPFAGKHVLVVGSGESAFDIAADVSRVAAKTTVWSRSPITPGPRFINEIWADPDHDELETMKDEARWSKAKISDLLESMTTSRMANAAPLWAYSTIRHFIFGLLSAATPQSKVLSAWNRQATYLDPLLGDQHTIPTKSARLCGEAARGRAHVIIAKEASFSGKRASFSGVTYDGNGTEIFAEPRETTVDDIDVILACTGYKTDFSWLDVPGLEWNPRTWFKHCFPKDHGDKLMFLGWARPHQGGIPACAEMLARYIAMLLDGTRALPSDYAERGRREGADEHQYYRSAQHQVNVVDYPAFMDSVARLIGCLPEPPKASRPERLVQYWVYPSWPIWYRTNGPGAKPDLVDHVLDHFPLGKTFAPHPFNLMALGFSLLQAPVDAVLPARSGLGKGWAFKAKKRILHDNV